MHTPLETSFIHTIQEQGPLSLETFWERALFDPQEGYYQRQQAQGIAKDFTTSPEVSQLFGEILGIWLVDQWQRMGSPQAVHLIELGPGRGTMMADILRVARAFPEFTQALNVILFEKSVFLQEAQHHALDSYGVPLHWVQNEEDLGDLLAHRPLPLMILGNEFLDALPLRQYEKTAKGWQERRVNWDEEQGFFLTPSGELIDQPLAAEGEIGDVFETSPMRDAILDRLVSWIKSYGGLVWLCDYGTKTCVYGDSFQGLYKGDHGSPLMHVGQTDLSSHVYFDDIEALFARAGLEVYGPHEQRYFLFKYGIKARLDLLKKKAQSLEKRAELEAQYRRLTDPFQMGDLFKVIAGSWNG